MMRRRERLGRGAGLQRVVLRQYSDGREEGYPAHGFVIMVLEYC